MRKPLLANSLTFLGLSLLTFFRHGPPSNEAAVVSIVFFGIALSLGMWLALLEPPPKPKWREVKMMQRELVERWFA